MTKPPRKYEKPLHVDAPFDEALEQFVQTEPAELSEMSDEQDDRQPSDVRVTEDLNGNICISDLFVMANRPKNRRPNDWHRGARAKALEGALVERITGDSRNQGKKAEISTYYTVGRGGGTKTYAHPVLALDYAEFLDPALGIAVRETFLRFRAADVSLAKEIIEKLSEQAEYDQLSVELRDLLKKHNRESAGVAQDAGVTDFSAYNGAGLRGLYGGLNKAAVLRKKGLDPDDHHLEFAGHEELAANYFKATQAIAKLKREKIEGQQAAEDAHEEVGEAVRKTIGGLGGTMPEDEPAIEDIREARKRIKASGTPEIAKKK